MIVDTPVTTEQPVPNEEGMAIEEIQEEEEDEMKIYFDNIDSNNQLTPALKTLEYIKLLQNERVDDIAVKVKEQSIYKYAHLTYIIISCIFMQH